MANLQKKALIEVLGAHSMLNISHRDTYIFKSLISMELSLKRAQAEVPKTNLKNSYILA